MLLNASPFLHIYDLECVSSISLHVPELFVIDFEHLVTACSSSCSLDFDLVFHCKWVVGGGWVHSPRHPACCLEISTTRLARLARQRQNPSRVSSSKHLEEEAARLWMARTLNDNSQNPASRIIQQRILHTFVLYHIESPWPLQDWGSSQETRIRYRLSVQNQKPYFVTPRIL